MANGDAMRHPGHRRGHWKFVIPAWLYSIFTSKRQQ